MVLTIFDARRRAPSLALTAARRPMQSIVSVESRALS
jgi:hypothetical protein